MARSGRNQSSPQPDPIRVRFDAFELDEANVRLLCEGKALTLPPTPFAVLCALARRPGSLLNKHDLLDEVWGHRFVGDSVLKTAISDLRTVLGDDPRNPRFIETVSRRGYRFIAATQPVSTAPTTSPAQAPQAAIPAAPFFVGRIGCTDAASARLGRRLQRPAFDRLGGGRAGHRQDGADRAFHREPRRRRLCTRPVRGSLRHLRAVPSRSRSARGPVPARQHRRTAAACRGADLAAAAAMAEHGGGTRRLATRAAGVSPDRMPREMGELLDRYTDRRPLLLVIEDLHWSDRATIELIDFLARRRSSPRLMWLASFRLAEVVALDHPLNPLRHELRLHGLCDEIVLDSFSESEVAEYVAERYPSLASDEAFVRALHARTDGVPLFVASVMSDVAARAAQSGDETQRPRRRSRTPRCRRISRPSSTITLPGSAASSERCCRRRPFAGRSSVSPRSRTRWGAMRRPSARLAMNLRASSCG